MILSLFGVFSKHYTQIFIKGRVHMHCIEVCLCIYICTYVVHMSSTFSGSSVLWRLKHSNVIEICSELIV